MESAWAISQVPRAHPANWHVRRIAFVLQKKQVVCHKLNVGYRLKQHVNKLQGEGLPIPLCAEVTPRALECVVCRVSVCIDQSIMHR